MIIIACCSIFPLHGRICCLGQTALFNTNIESKDKIVRLSLSSIEIASYGVITQMLTRESICINVI